MATRQLERRKPRVRVTARAAVLLVIVLVLLALGMAPLRAYMDERAKIAELERQTEVLQRATSHLDQRVAELNDPAELERIARECLVMVKPGETAFVLVPEHEGQPVADC
jgi:cell division protein FtsB